MLSPQATGDPGTLRHVTEALSAVLSGKSGAEAWEHRRLCPFVHSLIHSFIPSFACLLMHSFTHTLVQSLIHSYICSITHSLLVRFWPDKGVTLHSAPHRPNWSLNLPSTLPKSLPCFLFLPHSCIHSDVFWFSHPTFWRGLPSERCTLQPWEPPSSVRSRTARPVPTDTPPYPSQLLFTLQSPPSMSLGVASWTWLGEG